MHLHYADHASPTIRSSTSFYARPTRFRAEAETACAGTRASLPHASKILSEDQIVCQSKLYDAFELQGLEQQLDRKLNFLNDHNKSKLYDAFELQTVEQQLGRKLNSLNDHKSRSFSCFTSDQESLNYKKSLISVSNLLNNSGPSPSDHLRRQACCICNFCSTNTPLNSLIGDSALPKYCNQTDHLLEEAGCSCNESRQNMNDLLHNASYAARRASSMPHFHYHDIKYEGNHSELTPAKPANLVAAKEALQDLQNQRVISSSAKELKAQRIISAKSSRWSLIKSLCRSLREMHKKRDCMHIVQDKASNSTSFNVDNQKQRNEFQHHHYNTVHYHHVYHHHHHHVVNDIHFEEIDWPLSPARLQELGWLMPKSPAKMEDFEQIDWPLSPARLQDLISLMPESSAKMEGF